MADDNNIINDNVDAAVDALMESMPEDKPMPTPMLDAFNGVNEPEPAKEPTEEPKVEVESAETSPDVPEPQANAEDVNDTPQEKPEQSQSLRDIMAKMSAQDAENRRLKDALKQRQIPTPEDQKQGRNGPDLHELAKKKDVNAIFEELGLTFDDALESWDPNAQNEPQQVNKQVSREIEELRQHNQQLQERFQAMQNENFVTSEIKAFTKQATEGEEKYPVLNNVIKGGLADEAMNYAMQIASNVYNQTHIIPDKADILDEVEKIYHTRAKLMSGWLPQDKPAESESAKTPTEVAPAPTPDGQGDTQVSRELTEDEIFELALKKLAEDS